MQLGTVEATFSRAFAEFAEAALPQHTHDALIKKALNDVVIPHKSTDSTAIEAREKPQIKTEQAVLNKKSRPKKGEKRPKREPIRLEMQSTMTLPLKIFWYLRESNLSRGVLAYSRCFRWFGYIIFGCWVDDL